jgi:hypothetical protein
MTPSAVMAGLVPAIHAFPSPSKAWMPGTSPGMTKDQPIGLRVWK